MPGNYVWADSPVWQRELSEQEQITQIQDYLFIWAEQMRYVLRNLDDENFNDAGLRKITAPVYLELEKESEELTNRIAITAEGLTAQISSVSSQLALKADSSAVTLAIQGVEGQITTVSSSVSGLTTRVSNAEGSITTLSQTVNGLTISASNGTDSSTLSLKSGSTTLSSTTVQITGMVTFSTLSTSNPGVTIINGDNITTGKIEGINFYSSSMVGGDPAKGFVCRQTYENAPPNDIGGIRHEIYSIGSEGVFRNKLYLYTERYYLDDIYWYPSIKMESAGRISIEASPEYGEGYIYMYAYGTESGNPIGTAISIRTGDYNQYVSIQCGLSGAIFEFHGDGLYKNGTRVL